MPEAISILDLIAKGGIIGLLVVILVGGMRQWWVFGWQYRQVLGERDEFKKALVDSLEVARKVVRRG